ncbi:hypothetical protein ACJX0J_013283, partial [Zea mays]
FWSEKKLDQYFITIIVIAQMTNGLTEILQIYLWIMKYLEIEWAIFLRYLEIEWAIFL